MGIQTPTIGLMTIPYYMEIMEKTGWLSYVGDEILPSYIGIIISQYRDPYFEDHPMTCKWLICPW